MSAKLSKALKKVLLPTIFVFSIYSADDRNGKIERFLPQPIPDYVRWFETEELHYLSIKRTMEIINCVAELKTSAGIFLPSNLLDTILRITDEVFESY